MKKNRGRQEEEVDGERKSVKFIRKRMIENYKEMELGWSRGLHSEAGKGQQTTAKGMPGTKVKFLTHVEGCLLCQPVRAL